MLLSLSYILATFTLAWAARETRVEAAVHTRELIAFRGMNTGVLMSTYKDLEGLEGIPVGLQEYYAPFPDGDGDLLFLAMPISKVFRNALPPYEPNVTMTISDLYGFGDGNLAAGRYRVALFGALERVKDSEWDACEEAYLAAHPDARGWIPPNGPHSSFYARFRVSKIFAFDGFGDIAYIGWLPLDLYRSAGKLMRSEKEVHRDWPVPVQPEQFVGEDGDVMFAETSPWGLRVKDNRLRIQQ